MTAEEREKDLEYWTNRTKHLFNRFQIARTPTRGEVEIFKREIREARREQAEKDAKMIEGHRCDVTCGDPFMGKVLAQAIRKASEGERVN